MKARELSNVKTVKAMKYILQQKLIAEGVPAKTSDLKFEAVDSGYKIVFQDYIANTFEMMFDYDIDWGYMVNVAMIDYDNPDDAVWICNECSHSILDVYSALMEIGYTIANQF